MKTKITFSLLLLVLSIFSTQAQVFWSDTFEDSGAPSSGTRVAENNTGTGSPFTSYFARTNNAGINVVTSLTGGYLSGEGSKFWAGEDHDGITGTAVAGTEEQQIDWTGINISGKSNLYFSGLFAANNTTAAFENAALGASNTDYIIVEYRLNGTGAYGPLLRFYANNAINSGTNNKALALDTDANTIGDGVILTSTFQGIEVSIPGTGSTIDIRIRAAMNGGSEEWAIDNFVLREGPGCSNPIAYNVTGGGSGTTVPVGLSNSEIGVNYQLKNGTTNVGSPVAGTGAAISFGNQNTSGTYTVVATRVAGACMATMTGNAVVTITPLTGIAIWTDTFEDTGAPSTGTRNAENNTGTGSPFTSFFARTNNAGINVATSATGGFLSGQGAKFWAGENHDEITGALISGTEEQQIDWNGINIAGKTNLAFRGLFAANNISASFDTQALGATHSDYIIVEYSIDGGPYLPFLRFYGNNNITTGINNKSLALDTDGNNIGDGTILTSTFQQFETLIPQTGTVLNLRVRAFTNGSSEEWAMDNLQLLEGVLSTNNFTADKGFRIFPNPTNGSTLNITSDFGGNFEIFNQLGQSVKSFTVNANENNTISVDQLANGVYFIKGTNGTKISTQKLIIKK